MIPGEVIPKAGEIELNAGASTVLLTVANTGDRPVQVGSHYHFFETNEALDFDRVQARGLRLDIAAGTAIPRCCNRNSAPCANTSERHISAVTSGRAARIASAASPAAAWSRAAS